MTTALCLIYAAGFFAMAFTMGRMTDDPEPRHLWLGLATSLLWPLVGAFTLAALVGSKFPRKQP